MGPNCTAKKELKLTDIRSFTNSCARLVSSPYNSERPSQSGSHNRISLAAKFGAPWARPSSNSRIFLSFELVALLWTAPRYAWKVSPHHPRNAPALRSCSCSPDSRAPLFPRYMHNSSLGPGTFLLTDHHSVPHFSPVEQTTWQVAGLMICPWPSQD